MASDRFNRLILKINKQTEVNILPVDDGYSYCWEWHGETSESFDDEELALIDWIQKVCDSNENIPVKAQAKNEKKSTSNRALLLQLQRLVDAAASEVDKWRNEISWRNPTVEEYDNHRYWLYKELSSVFWGIANQITRKVDYYESPITNYEEDMRAFLKAHDDTTWIEAAIEGDEEVDC